MSKNKTAFIVFVLGTLSALGPFSIDMYLPGFEFIAKDLKTSVSDVSLTLSSYYIGISVGQLLYGPLLDKFGRKIPLYSGLILYIVASFICFTVQDINQFIFFRFFQALGSCAATVASITFVRDLFEVKDIPKIISKLMLVIGLSPMFAPTVGSLVIKYFEWRSIFLVLVFIGITIMLLAINVLPNTNKKSKNLSLKPKPMILSFYRILKNPQFFTYSFSGSLAFSGLFTYVASSPIIFMKIYDVNQEIYGYIFAFMSLSFILASQLNNLILKKITSEKVISMILKIQLLIVILFFTFSILNVLNLYSTIMFLFLFLACLGISNPNNSALTLAPFTQNTGTASALMGAIQLSLGSLTSFFIGAFLKDDMFHVTILLLVTTILANLVLIFGRKKIGHKTH